jgi:hypothetical protein
MGSSLLPIELKAAMIPKPMMAPMQMMANDMCLREE